MGLLEPTELSPPHPTEEILEDYALDRLPEALAAHVEEHLLICPSCQESVLETDEFTAAMKGLASHPAPVLSQVLAAGRNGLRALPRVPGAPVLVPVLAMFVLAFLMVSKAPQAPSKPVAVSLSSLRGSDALSTAPAGKSLALSMEAPDLVSGREYRIEVVDAGGRTFWGGSASPSAGKLVATVAKPLTRGVYWVRLFGKNSELLREFGLSAK